MGTRHVHADVIKAWADGAEIEVYRDYPNTWVDCPNPWWEETSKYRVKPKPTIVTFSYRVVLLPSGVHHIQVAERETDRLARNSYLGVLKDWTIIREEMYVPMQEV